MNKKTKYKNFLIFSIIMYVIEIIALIFSLSVSNIGLIYINFIGCITWAILIVYNWYRIEN